MVAKNIQRCIRDKRPLRSAKGHLMIQVENLTKSYGDRVLFDGVGFKLNPRERLGLVGHEFQIIIVPEIISSGI